MNEKTLTRETAIEALIALSSANAMILESKGTMNQHRTDTIAEMVQQLNAEVTTTKSTAP
jgi:uncharacterized Fe-S cluster-containing radical SAM superfamily protein|tara:strand:- start:2813 stop:2992 length:180 start_codon:yes stop_codon:yes gene_type:complete